MTGRFAQFRFAAAAFGAVIWAVAGVSLTAQPAHAFTMETLSTNGENTTRFADPSERSKNSGQQGGLQLFGQDGPTVQLNAGQTPYRPFAPRSGYAPLAPATGGN
jgi:hypothetical protein